MIDNVHPCDLPAWLEKMQANGTPVLLDVREPHELQTASVKPGPGYTLLTIPMGVVVPRINELDPTLPIACICHHGGRSARVAEYLAGQGFAHVANITGGINAWSMQVDSTVPRY